METLLSTANLGELFQWDQIYKKIVMESIGDSLGYFE